MRKFLSCVVGGLMLAALLPSAATAADRGRIAVARGEQIEKSFPAIPAAQPQRVVVVTSAITAASCKSANNCDTIVVDISVPPGFRNVHFVNVELLWDGSTGNMLYMYQWNSDKPEEAEANRQAKTSRNDTQNPKNILLDQPEGEYYFTVVNMGGGTNTGYKLRLTWIESADQIVDLSGYNRPRPGENITPMSQGTRPSVPTRPTSSFDFGDDYVDDAPVKRARTVLVPGPDGQLVAMEMPVIARGNRTPPVTRRFDPVVATMVGVLLFMGALVAFFAIRSRRNEILP
ncbi:MAG TPA: hypothetical protein VM840_11605 [Actinomycetota bacterium]|nr:hypothetical protein [Actinomycetota bacterium]